VAHQGHKDRLSAVDASFLAQEKQSSHMHVGALVIFDGPAPSREEFRTHLEARLERVPRYRQKLAFPPLEAGRPFWIDDPSFNLDYHVRHTALPKPGTDDQLRELAGRIYSQRLDRSKPLWENWIVHGLEGGRFALISKTHHALVDGVSGVDIANVLFDTAREPAPVPQPSRRWVPRPLPTSAQLLAESLLERATVPGEVVRGVRAMLRAPRRAVFRTRDALIGVGAMAWAGVNPAPPSPFNVPIGPHRKFRWLQADLGRFKAIKNALGGTVNDAVLSVVTLMLGSWLREHGQDTRGLVLKAMVPVSVRADVERGALGNRVAAMWAPLPVGIEEPALVFAEVHEAMEELKSSGQAVGAQVLTGLTGFAPPTLMSQAARLQSRQRFFNLVVTNVPGPQFDLYVLGRQMRAIYPVVPLAERQALGVAIMSYAGTLNFGLLADLDALPDLDEMVGYLRTAIDSLSFAAGVDGRPSPSPRRRRTPTKA
jgi:diacylglycerol O-acyltransferase / wax synthase